MTTTTALTLPCAFDVSGRRSFRYIPCRKPADTIVTDRMGSRVPMCAQHQRQEQRRKYATDPRPAPVTQADIDAHEAREAERIAAKAEQDARAAAERQRKEAVWREQTARDFARRVVVDRSTYQEYQGYRDGEPVYDEHPQWHVRFADEDPERDGFGTVRIERRYDHDFVRMSISSEITPKAARALAQALLAAADEAEA